jgi:3-oxoacyl-[acyl-carrier protein] reductase
MSDLLVRLSANKTASSLLRTLRIPVPLPQVLERATGPGEEEALRGRQMVLHAQSPIAPLLRGALTNAGAQLIEGEAPDAARPHGLVFDATDLRDPAGLDALYAFFHAQVRGMSRNGRCVVLVRPPADAADAVQRAARRAVEGFVRSLAKELGRKGSTAQTLYVEEGADDRIAPVLRFLLSPNAAFISGQPVRISSRVPLPGAVPGAAPLKGRVALVTGSARGIGEATARILAREGAHVIVMDRPAELEAAQTVAKEIGGAALGCDITSEDAPQVIRDYLAQHHGGGLDILVHNAGITRDKMLVNMDASRWNMVLEVNLRALIRVNEALLDVLREEGRIVCLSSIGGIGGNAGQTNYAATKAGVIGYVEGLAETLAPRGITVNAIAPGFIETQMTAQMPFGPREVGRRLSSLSQGGLPQDVAEAITFLSTPGAAGITGQTLRVCGGSFLGA